MELNKIYCGDCRNMIEVDDNSIHLTVGSPPYAVGKNYESYISSLKDHFQLLYDAYKEVVRVTVPGGKICINIGDIAVGSHYNGGFPQEIMVIDKIVSYLETLDTYLYARIIWEKDDPWQNSSHVTFHNKVQHAEYRILPAWEYVFVFRKGKSRRIDKSFEDHRWITKDEWKKWVHGVWKIRSVQKNDFHEAMFPDELVRRCIKMYSFPGDVVLDPFMGRGTVGSVARRLQRHYIGYELDPRYVKLAESVVAGDALMEPQRPYEDKTENRDKYQGDLFK
jgi:modification methylase